MQFVHKVITETVLGEGGTQRIILDVEDDSYPWKVYSGVDIRLFKKKTKKTRKSQVYSLSHPMHRWEGGMSDIST